MSIVDSTQRQLIRNRIHEVTDLALEINEGEAHRVSVLTMAQQLDVAVYQRTGRHGSVLVTQRRHAVVIPGPGASNQQHQVAIDTLDDLISDLATVGSTGGAQ